MRTQFPKGTVIFAEGDLGLAMFVIESGTVEIRKHLGGEDRVLAALGKGDFFGEMCMLEEEAPRSATAFAVEDVAAVMIDQAAFTFILKHNPEIAIRMMRKLVLRLEHTTHLLEEAVGHKVDIEESGYFGQTRSQTRSKSPLGGDQQRHRLPVVGVEGDDCRQDRSGDGNSPGRRSHPGRRQTFDFPAARQAEAGGATAASALSKMWAQ